MYRWMNNNTEFYLTFPMYVLLDLEILSASIEITYSVQVVLRVRFAERRNFPFSTSKAADITKQISSQHSYKIATLR